MQVCHGKAAPLGRGSSPATASSTTRRPTLRREGPAAGLHGDRQVRDGEPYQEDMGGGFAPFRRDVELGTAEEVPIRPLLGRLQFTPARRTGAISCASAYSKFPEHDMDCIAAAMGAAPSLVQRRQQRFRNYTVCTSTTPDTALIAPAICGETLKRPGSFISTSVSRSSMMTSETSPSAPPKGGDAGAGFACGLYT